MDELCGYCKHPKSIHGKQIPEQAPIRSHTCVCASNINMDGTPSKKPCDCGGDYPTPSWFDPGCFDYTVDENGRMCGCIEFE